MKLISYLVIFKICFALFAAQAAVVTNTAAKSATDLTEANIARLVSKMLERQHYSQRDFDDEVSSNFFDRYFETLDGLHLHFLQSDIAEFESYRLKLDDLTGKTGDTSPGHLIFARMLERVKQRVAYANELLKTEKFEFTGNERYTPNRRELPRPKDLAEAREIWRQHLRFEFLQEKLSMDTNKLVTAKRDSTGTKKDFKAAIGPTNTELPGLKNDLAVGQTKFVFDEKNDSITPDAKRTISLSTTNRTNALTQTEQIIQKLTKRYATIERTYKDLKGDDVLEIYLTSLARVYDPHSDYMGRAHFENFNISMQLSLVGIGALLESEDGYCKIKELMDGPAKKSKKINPGDRIVAVAQGDKEPVDVVDMKLNKVVELIRGEKGTEVRLTVWPADAADSSVRKIVTLIRDVIKLEDQEAKAKVIEIPDKKETKRLGIIDLPSFYAGSNGDERKSTTADIAKLLKKLNEEKVSGIVLDLRRNGGGLLEEAVALTGLFITNGPVVQVKEYNGEIHALADLDSSIVYKGPLIILTSRFSASASEILAGALQDYGRAIVIGDSSTYGKGTVQKLLKLDAFMDQNKLSYSYHPGALKPTTAKFYRAGGSSTQLRGVIPDMKLPSVLDYAEVGEASMDDPLPWDEVSTTSFKKWDIVKPYLPALQKRSDERIKTDKDFAYIKEDIEEFKKNLADRSLSLNEEVRRKEKKEADEREEARKKERKARQQTEPKIYEVTLKNAGEPGLQVYVPKSNDVAVAEVEHSKTDPDDEAALEEKVPAIDATIEEAKRILLDYISLLPPADRALSKVE